MSRLKKPPVLLEKRRVWLARNEAGESPPQIAEADGFDARTVRKHIDIARQERETKDARSSVLRNALEQHYADLCRYAERLLPLGEINEFNINANPSVPYEQQLGIALRQHVPRSPLWGYLNQRKKLYEEKNEITKLLNNRIETEVSSDPRVPDQLIGGESRIIPGMVSAFQHQTQQWAKGYKGLDPDSDIVIESVKDDLVQPRYGGFGMGKLNKNDVEAIRTALKLWIPIIKGWEEYANLERISREIRQVEEKIRDEVVVIALRRVVPGRCRYCPL